MVFSKVCISILIKQVKILILSKYHTELFFKQNDLIFWSKKLPIIISWRRQDTKWSNFRTFSHENCHKILETEQNHKIKDHFLSQVMWSRMIPNSAPNDHYLKHLCRSTFPKPSWFTDYVTSADRYFRNAKTKLWNGVFANNFRDFSDNKLTCL